MSIRNDQLILSASIGGNGFHPGATSQPQRPADVTHYRHLAQVAERGLLDFVLLDDERALRYTASGGRLDAISVLSHIAPDTNHIGLAATVPTTYSEPFNVSRQIATLDFVSSGRAGWNASVSDSDEEARNFGRSRAPDIVEQRERTDEFVEVSRKLWDSWEDNAIITDREQGIYLDPYKLHHINHAGKHFRIRGPQITYRPPQGHPVIIQVEQGDAGAPSSSGPADVLILHYLTIEDEWHAYTRLKELAGASGKPAHELIILQSILPILGKTEKQARARAAELDASAARQQLKRTSAAARFVGTAEQLAIQLERWFMQRAVDGFHLLPDILPDGLEAIILARARTAEAWAFSPHIQGADVA